ncbi:MAG: WbuC family cupin fold metalloprotein [Rhodospirillales bacterium]|nr:WbuC family cupin fold metalloprotein [Rhodospirillales bacterium]
MAADTDKFQRQNDEVFYTSSPLTAIDGEDIAWLKARAMETPRRRARICAHPAADAPLHEMIIVHERGTYVPPHRHIGRSESYTIIEGRMRIVLFDEEGKIDGTVDMSTPGQGGTFFYRLSGPQFHSMLIDSDWIVFHEVTSGPFDPKTTEFASWAPGNDDPAAAQAAFREDLLQRLNG